MSLSIVQLIMDRIKTAAPDSPIAVFMKTSSGDSKDGMLDAVFASTVFATHRAKFDSGYLGSFDRNSHMKKTKLHLDLSLEGK